MKVEHIQDAASQTAGRRQLKRAWRVVAAGCTLSLALFAGQVAAQTLKVVASFSILADMVAQVGGDHISLSTIVGPDGDAHVYEPTPQDAKALAGAQLLFVNGLEFEGWLPRLVQASGFQGTQVVATQGITPLVFSEAEHDDDHDHDHDHEHAHAHGGVDPHAWQDLRLAQRYVNNITWALVQADPQHAETYRARSQAYVQQLAALDADIRARVARIPQARRKVVTSHDAFGYFAHAYDITFLAAAGISSQAEPSARDMARLIDQIRRENIRDVFVENITSPRLIEQLARETGARLGGVLYSDALSAKAPADTYLGMMRWNAQQLLGALEAR